MDAKKFINSDRRLVILRSLYDMAGYSGNDSMLEDCLMVWGHMMSRDEIKTQIAWLAEQDLVTREEMGDNVICRLTSRGEDVATGRAIVPGVKRPRA